MVFFAVPGRLRKLTASATGLVAFYCVFHADYGARPHAFSWLQAYYRHQVVQPLQRQYAKLTAPEPVAEPVADGPRPS